MISDREKNFKSFYRSTGIVAGIDSSLVVFVTGIVAGMMFPTFVADHGYLPSPQGYQPNCCDKLIK